MQGHACCKLLSLPEELIVMISFLCSVEDVVVIASTCRYLRRLHHNRALWIRLLGSLDVHQAPNVSPTQSLNTLSSATIREKVIDAVKKDHEWHKRGRVKIHHSQELLIPAPGGAESRTCIGARILPGQKEVVVLNCGRIELWRLQEGQLIWACPDYEGGQFCLTYDFEVADDGKTLNIACVFDSMIHVYPTLRVFTYDYDTQAVTLSFESKARILPFCPVTICGSLLLLSVSRMRDTMIIDWKSSLGMKFRFVYQGQEVNPQTSLLAADCLSSFMFLPKSTILAIPLSDLREYFDVSDGLGDWPMVRLSVDTWHMMTLPEVSSANAGIPPCVTAAHTFRPSWIKNANQEIYITVYDFSQKELVAYRLQLPQLLPSASLSPRSGAGEYIKLVSTKSLPCEALSWVPGTHTNSGRVVGLLPGAQSFRCFSLFSDKDQPSGTLELDEDIPGSMSITTIEPWSGSIAVGTPGRLRIYHL